MRNSHAKIKNECLLKSQASYQLMKLRQENFSVLFFVGKHFVILGTMDFEGTNWPTLPMSSRTAKGTADTIFWAFLQSSDIIR